MTRRFSKFFVATSAALMLLAVAIGVRSYRTGDIVSVTLTRWASADGPVRVRELHFVTGRGRFLFSNRDLLYNLAPSDVPSFAERFPPGTRAYSHRQPPDGMIDVGWGQSVWGRAGFGAQHYQGAGASSARSVTRVACPFWAPALLLSIPPLLHLVAMARRRGRAREGLCPACRYDLRATPDSCPECGWRRATDGVSQPRTGRRVLRFASATAAALVIVCTAALVITGWRHQSPQGGDRGNHDARLPDQQTVPSPFPGDPGLTAGTRPTTQTALTAPRPSPIARLPQTQPFVPEDINRPISPADRALAATLDPARVYVFFDGRLRDDLIRRNLAPIQMFAFAAGRWTGETIVLRPGDSLARPGFPTAYRIGTLAPAPGGNYSLTLVDAAGKVLETRSANADANDPLRSLLARASHWSSQRQRKLFEPSK